MFSWWKKKSPAILYVERDPRVVVAVITSDYIEPECLESITSQSYQDFSLLIHRMNPRPMSVQPIKNGIRNMIRNRNMVRKMLLATDADAFFLVDSDIILPPDALKNLLQHHLDFLCGWYKSKGIGGLWVSSEIRNNELFPYAEVHHSVIRVTCTGLGCALISRRLLEAVPFRDGTDQYFRFNNKLLFSDDSTQFCMDAAMAGYPCCMDGDTVCEHLMRTNESSYQNALPISCSSQLDSVRQPLDSVRPQLPD